MRVGAEFAWGADCGALHDALANSFLRREWAARVETRRCRVVFDATLAFSDAAALCETFAEWREARAAGVVWRAGYVPDSGRFLAEGFSRVGCRS